MVNADGSQLHRITAERNGADRPLVDPQTGKIVYARWWMNGHPASDNMTTLTDPVYGGYLLHLGLATDDSGRYTAAQRASLGPAYEQGQRTCGSRRLSTPMAPTRRCGTGGPTPIR